MNVGQNETMLVIAASHRSTRQIKNLPHSLKSGNETGIIYIDMKKLNPLQLLKKVKNDD
jgi:hypothetical protein